jgi:hypothetical protein
LHAVEADPDAVQLAPSVSFSLPVSPERVTAVALSPDNATLFIAAAPDMGNVSVIYRATTVDGGAQLGEFRLQGGRLCGRHLNPGRRDRPDVVGEIVLGAVGKDDGGSGEQERERADHGGENNAVAATAPSGFCHLSGIRRRNWRA